MGDHGLGYSPQEKVRLFPQNISGNSGGFAKGEIGPETSIDWLINCRHGANAKPFNGRRAAQGSALLEPEA